MDLELDGKVALVTGGSRGIGKAIAMGLASEGCDVALLARTIGPLEEAAGEIEKATGRRAFPVVADITSAGSVDAAVTTASQELGTFDILVNCGGGAAGGAGPLEALKEEDLAAGFDVKYNGYLRCVRAVVPGMRTKGWGRIINIGGLAYRTSGTYGVGARNAAVTHLSKSLADELGPSGITVNAVHPGTTMTERTIEAMKGQAQRQGVTFDQVVAGRAEGNAIRRLAEPEEVAHIVVFLCSPKAGVITGDVVAAGGGGSRSVYY
jgi:NAD(P)-dependent dehydrogenase (short-subunit alcohol dehydrogenase family)